MPATKLWRTQSPCSCSSSERAGGSAANLHDTRALKAHCIRSGHAREAEGHAAQGSALIRSAASRATSNTRPQGPRASPAGRQCFRRKTQWMLRRDHLGLDEEPTDVPVFALTAEDYGRGSRARPPVDGSLAGQAGGGAPGPSEADGWGAERITVANRPECFSKALVAWVDRNGAQLECSRQGMPATTPSRSRSTAAAVPNTSPGTGSHRRRTRGRPSRHGGSRTPPSAPTGRPRNRPHRPTPPRGRGQRRLRAIFAVGKAGGK